MTSNAAAAPDDDGEGGEMEPKPHDLAAQDFMAHKGYPDVKPVDVEETQPGMQWMFYYVLPDTSELELRVTWLEDDEEWDTFVEDYRRAPRR